MLIDSAMALHNGTSNASMLMLIGSSISEFVVPLSKTVALWLRSKLQLLHAASVACCPRMALAAVVGQQQDS